MEGEARYSLAQLAESLSVSYEAVRKSFWRKANMDEMKDHWAKVRGMIIVDEYGADILRASRRPVVVVRDETAERVKELTQQVESLRVALAEMDHERAEVYKMLADERSKTVQLIEENRDLQLKLLTVHAVDDEPATDERVTDSEVIAGQPKEEPAKRPGWFKRLFGR